MRWQVALRKSIGDGVQRFDLDVAFDSAASRLALLGPSGAGKSLTLKAVAGLLRPDAGQVRIDGEPLFDRDRGIDLPARRRRLGYLFQEYALFPHLTVRQNVAFGLHAGWRNPPRAAAACGAAVGRWLEALELDALADRLPDQLSGGQRQRVALARALAPQPRALLLDEPFAALDAPLRQRLRGELARLQASLGVPMLLITHDEADVEALADEVVHIEAGRVAGRPVAVA